MRTGWAVHRETRGSRTLRRRRFSNCFKQIAVQPAEGSTKTLLLGVPSLASGSRKIQRWISCTWLSSDACVPGAGTPTSLPFLRDRHPPAVTLALAFLPTAYIGSTASRPQHPVAPKVPLKKTDKKEMADHEDEPRTPIAPNNNNSGSAAFQMSTGTAAPAPPPPNPFPNSASNSSHHHHHHHNNNNNNNAHSSASSATLLGLSPPQIRQQAASRTLQSQRMMHSRSTSSDDSALEALDGVPDERSALAQILGGISDMQREVREETMAFMCPLCHSSRMTKLTKRVCSHYSWPAYMFGWIRWRRGQVGPRRHPRPTCDHGALRGATRTGASAMTLRAPRRPTSSRASLPVARDQPTSRSFPGPSSLSRARS